MSSRAKHTPPLRQAASLTSSWVQSSLPLAGRRVVRSSGASELRSLGFDVVDGGLVRAGVRPQPSEADLLSEMFVFNVAY